MLAPAHVLQLVLIKPDVTHLSSVLTGCFGAQACICGALFATARMTRATYLTFAWGMIPFFVLFNYWFVFVDPMFNKWMLLDVAGSVVIVLACLWGLHTLDAEAATSTPAKHD